MRVTFHYSAGKQTVSAGGVSVDLLTMKDGEAHTVRNDILRLRFGSAVAARFISEQRAEREALRQAA